VITNARFKVGQTTKIVETLCIVLESNIIVTIFFYFFLNLAFFAATMAFGDFGLA